MSAKVVVSATKKMLEKIENEATLKAAKNLRKLTAAKAVVMVKIEKPEPTPAGKGMSRNESKTALRASRKVVAPVAPTKASAKKKGAIGRKLARVR